MFKIALPDKQLLAGNFSSGHTMLKQGHCSVAGLARQPRADIRKPLERILPQLILHVRQQSHGKQALSFSHI